jgi:hypothetical protein
MRCRGVQGIANAAYLKGFPFSVLLRVAPYCVPSGIRAVSGRATATVGQQIQWHALATFGVTICRHLFLSVAVCCTNRLPKPINLLAVAQCFCVLRARWCQKWCQMVSAAPQMLRLSYSTEVVPSRRAVESTWGRPRR